MDWYALYRGACVNTLAMFTVKMLTVKLLSSPTNFMFVDIVSILNVSLFFFDRVHTHDVYLLKIICRYSY